VPPCVQCQPEGFITLGISATRKASNRQRRTCRQRSEVAVTRNLPWLLSRHTEWACLRGASPTDAHDCIMVRILSDPPNIRLWGADGPPPWQARLRSSPLLVVQSVNGKTKSQCLGSCPDATELAVVLGPVKEWPENVVRAEPLRQRPSLTAPARDGPENPRVGTEGWAPQGPNKRMISAEVRIGGTKKARKRCLWPRFCS
jgi:hypothetical protein